MDFSLMFPMKKWAEKDASQEINHLRDVSFEKIF
jgi:hypothetical protein